MNKTAKFCITNLNLQPHPEGGYFSEVYRSEETIRKDSLPSRYDGDRSFSTSIYFLLDGEQISKFHRLKSDEQWHFYDGCAVKIYIINEQGELSTVTLGKNLVNGEAFQTVIPSNHWFAAELTDKNSFCLVGCVVSPGFDFNDFELGAKDELISLFPQLNELIKKLTFV